MKHNFYSSLAPSIAQYRMETGSKSLRLPGASDRPVWRRLIKIKIKMKSSEVSQFARNLSEYYVLMLRNGWVLPARKCGVITWQYLNDVSACLTCLLYRFVRKNSGAPEIANLMTTKSPTKWFSKSAHSLLRKKFSSTISKSWQILKV